MSTSSACSSSGFSSSSACSSEISRWYISRWLDMETYSPAAIENDPASRPATPASSVTVREVPEPAKPITRAVFDTRPSLTPNTPARSVPDRSPRCHDSRRRICAWGSGRPPSIRCARVRACPRSSAAIPGAASGSLSYMPASAFSARSISGRTVFTDSLLAAVPISRVRRLGPPSAGISAPASRSLPSQCAACFSSIDASSRKISWRSPVSTSASREYSAAASRSLASISRQRLTDLVAFSELTVSVTSRRAVMPSGGEAVGAVMPRGCPRGAALGCRLSRRWPGRWRSRSPGRAGAGWGRPTPAASSGSW